MAKEAQAGEVPGPMLTLPDPAAASTGARPGEIPATALPRLARAIIGRLGAVGVDVDVRPLEDGRVALVLSPLWLELFLANMEAQAAAFKQSLYRARCEAMVREAELRMQLREARQEWEQERAAIRAEHARLVAGGLTYRQALHELKRQRGPGITITELAWAVGPEKRRRRA